MSHELSKIQWISSIQLIYLDPHYTQNTLTRSASCASFEKVRGADGDGRGEGYGSGRYDGQ